MGVVLRHGINHNHWGGGVLLHTIRKLDTLDCPRLSTIPVSTCPDEATYVRSANYLEEQQNI